MAVLAAPAVNWQDTPEPQSATALVSQSTIVVAPVVLNRNVLPLPSAGQLVETDITHGYAG